MTSPSVVASPPLRLPRRHRRPLRDLWPDPVAQQARRARGVLGWRIDAPGLYCTRCGATCGPGGQTPRGCAFCVERPQPWQRVVRLSSYHSPVSDWIKAMKFHAQWRWATWFGRQLGRRLGEPFDPRRVAVCPVPMHWLRRVRRGYNQSALLAQAVARQRNWPIADVLHRVRYTRPQTKVNPSRRHHNVHRSFGVAHIDLTGWEIWLIDDIKTSGATAGHCARLLHEAGAAMVNLAVVAVADPRGGDFKVI